MIRFLFLLIILFLSCSKDIGKPPLPIKNVAVSEELKEWGYFKKGSYWIYKDSVTQVTDSVFVTSVNHQTFEEESGDTNFIYQSITVYFSGDKPYSMYTLRSYSEDYIGFKDVYQHDHEMCIFKTAGLNSSYYGTNLIANQNIASVKIDTATFYDLRYISYSYRFGHASSSGCPYDDRVFWKKGVGIVKKSGYGVHGGYPKELIRYHAVQ